MGETAGRHLQTLGDEELPLIRLVDRGSGADAPDVSDALERAGEADPYSTIAELIACAEREDSAKDEFLRRRYRRRKEALFERLLL